jgi:hypothetical protein
MKRSLGLVVIGSATVAGMAVAGCGGSSSGNGTTAAVKYPTAQKLVAALNHGGMACTDAYYSKSAALPGVTSTATCTYKGTPQLVYVFSGAVSNKTVQQTSDSTSSERVYSVVGPNWMIETSKAYGEVASKAIGGKVVAGPAHQKS